MPAYLDCLLSLEALRHLKANPFAIVVVEFRYKLLMMRKQTRFIFQTYMKNFHTNRK